MGGSRVQTELLLGADGGGIRCRARLGEPSGAILGGGSAGPLVAREGDALSGALQLAEVEALLMPR
jgi:hypothetical protein